jgi:hypothetical protein
MKTVWNTFRGRSRRGRGDYIKTGHKIELEGSLLFVDQYVAHTYAMEQAVMNF